MRVYVEVVQSCLVGLYGFSGLSKQSTYDLSFLTDRKYPARATRIICNMNKP
jgi:hypothetical protein